MNTRPLSLTVNGRAVGPLAVAEGLSLLDVLNEYLGLSGTRLACGAGVCRACSVIVDQEDGSSTTLQSCITPAHAFEGKRIEVHYFLVEAIGRAGAGEPDRDPTWLSYDAALKRIVFFDLHRILQDAEAYLRSLKRKEKRR